MIRPDASNAVDHSKEPRDPADGKGLSRMTDVKLGVAIGASIVGN
jgi:hypothetical protein